LKSLVIAVSREDRQSEVEAIQWQEVLRPFTSVDRMTLDLSHLPFKSLLGKAQLKCYLLYEIFS
jgi:hypothetical protein